jgi:hypothetical protein
MAIVAFPSRGVAVGRGGSSLFFCLETKETKIQGSNFLCYKTAVSAKRFELAALKQQIFINASTPVLFHATKFKALASLGCAYSYFSNRVFPLLRDA